MAKKTFKLTLYRATLGCRLSASMSGTSFKANGIIHVGGESESGETGELLVYFLAPDSTVPKPAGFTKATGTYGGVCVPIDQFSYYIDLLRNEKPVWIELFTDDPEGNCVRVTWEPIGVNDDNT